MFRVRCFSGRSVARVALVAAFASGTGCVRNDAGAPSTGVSTRSGLNTVSRDSTGAISVYGATRVGMEGAAARGAVARIYVPNTISGTVSVIDPTTNTIIDTIPTDEYPEHVVVGYDLRTLWIASTLGNTLTPINPVTGKAGPAVAIDDPYNVYFTPDGRSMIVVAERMQRLHFRDIRSLEITKSVPLPCKGANHLDYTADGRHALLSCEFSSEVLRINIETQTVEDSLVLVMPDTAGHHGSAERMRPMPQDVRLSPDGTAFFVADMMSDGVWVIAADSLTPLGFIPTGKGAHGIAVSRTGMRFYIANRGWHTTTGGRRGPGSISVLDPIARKVIATWPVPDGGSPDMGNVSADDRTLWVSGRYDDEIYGFDTRSGALRARIPVGKGPHGLAVWPLPGRYSLGHTGNMR